MDPIQTAGSVLAGADPIVATDPTDACANCRFVKREVMNQDFRTVVSRCHRFPPQTAPLVGNERGQIAFVTEFPGVKPTQWCGEYRRAK